MRAYILRPFGTRDGIDFDHVEAMLIKPALAQLAIDSAGGDQYSGANIQTAILAQLATTDLVVADVSGASATVHFELGVRYTARDRFTVLIHARNSDPLFHLRQLRSLWYDPENPSSSLSQLVSLIQDTLRANSVDSPVYMAIPNLQPPSLPELQTAPPSFRDEVARASQAHDAGHLALLALEADRLPWRLPALRLIAEAQFKLRDYTGARKCLEVLRSSVPEDAEVNALLGTVYDRLGRAQDARTALDRVLASASASQVERAEALALTGRNLKSEWTESWRKASAEDRSLMAFRSPLLKASREAYLRAFKEDLNHFYSGLNALALTQIQLQLIQKHEEHWKERFEDDSESDAALRQEEQLATALAGAVDLALSSAADLAERKGDQEPWIEISRADLTFLTSKKPQRISRLYDAALLEAPSFARDSVRRQLQIYAELGIFRETVEPVLQTIGARTDLPAVRADREIKRVLLFSGHMIDFPDRPRPRFPADREEEARQAIQQALAAQEINGGEAIGMAGGSNGGDILFHEVCRQNNIKTELYLPIPEDDYVSRSVLPAGGNWMARYKSLRDSVPVHVLQASTELPDWLRLRGQADYSFWQRSNLWLLNSALAHRGASVTLIALWNGEQSDSPGGTKDLVVQARAAGAKCVVLNSNQIFGLK